MNVTDYTFLLNRPEMVNDRQTAALEKIVEEFPFFQSARALRLKGLYNEDSFKYNYALKVTAAHTTDRSVLFDFITSDSFTSIQKGFHDQKIEELHEIKVAESEEVMEAVRPEPKMDLIEQSILTSIKEAEPEIVTIPDTIFPEAPEIPEEIEEISQDPETVVTSEPETQPETVTEKLEIGKPLDFSKEEKHSFQEWLQLSAIQPIARETGKEPEIIEEPVDNDSEKQKKKELIDRFIEANPKIPPVKQDTIASITVEPSKADNTYLMTETLARVYLEQKKYHKAIQAYQILILKYPEKSSFFADRILDIKNLQQNNN